MKTFNIGDRVWYCGEGVGGPESLGTVNRIEGDLGGEVGYYVVWDDGSEGMDGGYGWGELMREGETWGDFDRENGEM